MKDKSVVLRIAIQEGELSGICEDFDSQKHLQKLKNKYLTKTK